MVRNFGQSMSVNLFEEFGTRVDACQFGQQSVSLGQFLFLSSCGKFGGCEVLKASYEIFFPDKFLQSFANWTIPEKLYIGIVDSSKFGFVNWTILERCKLTAGLDGSQFGQSMSVNLFGEFCCVC